ncbi:MAG: D-aminoacyl-tRNA deacylase [Dehalococcoidia bacterium]|nr:D-aminoacyl-tRNA deacylase [Dehalococcoidia bacterium]
MKAVIQRVTRASVSVDGESLGQIGAGLVALVGVAQDDTPEDARRLAEKTAELRIFSDPEGRFNLSLLDTGGQALVVSQFTLLADSRKGRRPSFTRAAAPEIARPLVERYEAALRERGITVVSGRFAAHMMVELVNDGPVTIILDTADLERPRRG